MEIGDKVVVISKSRGCDFADCPSLQRARAKGQPYMYITGTYCDLYTVDDEDTLGYGGYYLRQDLVPYISKMDAKSYWNTVIRKKGELYENRR